MEITENTPVTKKTRRKILLLHLPTSILAANITDHKTPTDPEVLNAFTRVYVAYLEKIKMGVIDLNAWGRVLLAWASMTKG